MVAISGTATFGLVASVLIGLAFVGGVVWLALRNRPEEPPQIPAAMRPGPSDETLERRMTERHVGWSIVFVLFFSAWLPVVWLREPTVNVADEVEAVDRSVGRGSRWFQVSTEENPTGFGCARCHGASAEGGTTPFKGEDYPVPSLNNVCERLTIEGPGQIRQTIMQGRQPATPMPSWSIRFAGPMNDQQIQDLINYLMTIQKVPDDANACLNPKLLESSET